MFNLISKKFFILGTIIIAGIGIVIAIFFASRFVYFEVRSQQELQRNVASLQETLLKTQEHLEAVTTTLQASLTDAQKESSVLSSTLAAERELRIKSETEFRTNLAQAAARTDVAAVISEWRPRIAHLTCTWVSGRTTRGSGLLIGKVNGNYNIQTNKHVVYDSLSNTSASQCAVKLPGDVAVTSKGIVFNSEGLDSATVVVSAPTDKMLGLAASVISKACASKPNLGEQIVVLGYPVIGAKEDITATEGIISGYDDDYYITSAKIEQGNSGGAALSIRNNCYLGIPTFTSVGRVEALGRILEWRALHIQ